jgi:hypothetical protein
VFFNDRKRPRDLARLFSIIRNTVIRVIYRLKNAGSGDPREDEAVSGRVRVALGKDS